MNYTPLIIITFLTLSLTACQQTKSVEETLSQNTKVQDLLNPDREIKSNDQQSNIKLNENVEVADPNSTSSEKDNMKKQWKKAPEMQIDQSKTYTATMKTDKGEMTIELYADKTPITVNNFVFLAKEKFYDGVIFHRTIPGFMIQGGDPTGTGTGGPGYKFADEKFSGKYTKGTLAMANSGPNTNGSQFFIMHADYNLPPNYVIFGKVTEGLDVIDAIASAPTKPGGEGSSPVTPVTIETVEISEN